MAETLGEDPSGTHDPPGGAVYAPGGTVGGRYRVLGFLGAGGMGEVYATEDLVLGQTLALKTLRSERESSARAVERLRREVALARKVTHRNVCRLYDVGEDDGRAFLTMELVEGETLAQRLQRGPLAAEELVEIAAQLVAGLQAAHAAGVVHRDLKSGNVLLAPGPRVVITDFGLACSTAPDDVIGMTGDHAVLGTPAYMSPEQVQGRPSTAASDVYALGVVLYEMATGELPFREDTALATATERLLRPPPRPSARRRDLDRRWETAILRCLAVAPAERPSPVEQVLALATRPRRRWPRVAAVLGLAAATAGALFLSLPRSRALPPSHWPAALRPASREAAMLFDRANQARIEDDRQAARQWLEQAVAYDPDDPAAEAVLADALDELGFAERAGDAVARALHGKERLGDEGRTAIELVAAERSGDDAGAVTAAERLVALAPGVRGYRLRLATALVAAGRADEADAVLDGLLPAGNQKEAIEIELARGSTALARGESVQAAARARTAARWAGEARRPHDEAAALVALADADRRAGEGEAATRDYRLALAAAERASDGRLALRARWGLIDLDSQAGRLNAVASAYVEQAALARRLGARSLLAELLIDNTWYLVPVGRLDEAAATLVASEAVARERENQVELAWVDAGRAYLARQRGDLREAVRHAELAFAAGERFRNVGLSGNAFHNWAEALLDLDDDAALAAALARRKVPAGRLIDAFIALRQGRLDDAERIAAPLVAPTLEGREAQVVMARVAVARGRLDEAERLLAEVAPIARGDGSSFLSRHHALHAQAELLAGRGDLRRALALLDGQAGGCAAAGLFNCELAARAAAIRLAPPDEAQRRAPAVLARARALGFRRIERAVSGP